MEEFSNQKPAKSFAKIIKFVCKLSDILGVDITRPQEGPNLKTAFVATVIIGYYIFTVLTVIELFESDWKVLLESTCMLGSVVQGSCKLITGLYKKSDLNKLFSISQELYNIYSLKGASYLKCLDRNVSKLIKINIFIGISYIIASLTIVTVPYVTALRTGEKVLIMHFIVPGIDVSTELGYNITNIFHMTCIFVAAFGLYIGDSIIILISMQCFLFADIFNLKVTQLNQMLAQGFNERNSKQTTEALNDLVQWHQLYTEFTDRCNHVSALLVSTQVMSSALAIILTIFIIITGSWPAAYPFLFITFYNMYVYCILGTKVETCNDEFNFEIYNIDWYNLLVPQQKVVLFMLNKSQKPALIQVAGVLPLSVATGLQITKTIYSISMMMIQLLTEEK